VTPRGRGPLDGLLVVDLTRALAGPYCTMMLADLGARVIKVETPDGGDDTRGWGPPFLEGESAYFMSINRNKESLTLNLKDDQGRDLLWRLLARADVLVENFRPGTIDRLGFGYETVRARLPRLVYCSISGFGQTGPWRQRPAFAHIVNAISGMMALEQGDEPAPRASNLQAADVLAATHASSAILAALWRRGRTGRGAHLDVSMLEALVGADSITFGSVLNGGGEHGNPRPGLLVYRVGDRYLAFQIGGAARIWSSLLAVMGHAELGADPRFATGDARRRNARELHAIIGEWVARFGSVDEALAVLDTAHIPCAPVLRPAELIAEPHLAERAFFPALPHPTRGSVRVTASPYHLDGEPVHPRRPAAYRVGEHTREVLVGLLGYEDDRVTDLLAAGVISAP